MMKSLVMAVALASAPVMASEFDLTTYEGRKASFEACVPAYSPSTFNAPHLSERAVCHINAFKSDEQGGVHGAFAWVRINGKVYSIQTKALRGLTGDQLKDKFTAAIGEQVTQDVLTDRLTAIEDAIDVASEQQGVIVESILNAVSAEEYAELAELRAYKEAIDADIETLELTEDVTNAVLEGVISQEDITIAYNKGRANALANEVAEAETRLATATAAYNRVLAEKDATIETGRLALETAMRDAEQEAAGLRAALNFANEQYLDALADNTAARAAFEEAGVDIYGTWADAIADLTALARQGTITANDVDSFLNNVAANGFDLDNDDSLLGQVYQAGYDAALETVTITRPDVSLIGTTRQHEVTGFNRNARLSEAQTTVTFLDVESTRSTPLHGGTLYDLSYNGHTAGVGIGIEIGDIVDESVLRDIGTAVESAYANGYNDGYQDGYNDGYAQGFEDGVNSVQ